LSRTGFSVPFGLVTIANARSVDALPAIAAPAAPRRRLPPGEREALIVAEAVRFFAENGFGGQTRELAARLGITQPLLYRYFPTKEALIERVYQEVFVGLLKQEWEALLDDRRIPFEERMIRFYKAYSKRILTYEWVRLFTFAGLKGLDLNARFLDMLRRRIFARVIREMRLAYGLPTVDEVPATELEYELVWGLHAGIFYIGVRKWIYGLPIPRNLDRMIVAKVKAFLEGTPRAVRDELGRPESRV
jgi:AcrR family transcriptional regulator